MFNGINRYKAKCCALILFDEGRDNVDLLLGCISACNPQCREAGSSCPLLDTTSALFIASLRLALPVDSRNVNIGSYLVRKSTKCLIVEDGQCHEIYLIVKVFSCEL